MLSEGLPYSNQELFRVRSERRVCQFFDLQVSATLSREGHRRRGDIRILGPEQAGGRSVCTKKNGNQEIEGSVTGTDIDASGAGHHKRGAYNAERLREKPAVPLTG